MSTPSQHETSLARDRPRRQNIAVPIRAQQEVEERRKVRTTYEDSVAQRAARVEAAARPAPLNDSNNFIFGTPIPQPPPRADRAQEDPDQISPLALHYLCKVATRNAKDLRAAFEQKLIGIPELKEAADNNRADEAPQPDPSLDVQQTTNPVGQKGKGRAGGPIAESHAETNYRGIIASNVSHPVQSKHALATAKQAHKQANRDATQGSPLIRTNTTTIYPGKEKTYPMTPLSPPRPRAIGQPASTCATNQGQPTRPPPASGQRTTVHNVAAAGQTPQPLAPLPRPVGTVLVPETQEDHRHRHESQGRPRHAPHPAPHPAQQVVRPAHSRAPPQDISSTRITAVRHSNNRAESRHTPITMGSWPPNRSKPNTTRKSTPRRDEHHDRASVARNQPVEDVQDIGMLENIDDIDNVDDVDNTNQDGNGSAKKKPRTRPCIKGHKPETQSTVRTMLDAALAHVLAGGTYEHPTTGPNSQTCEDLAAKAWGLACRKTKRDYPMQPSHLKVESKPGVPRLLYLGNHPTFGGTWLGPPACPLPLHHSQVSLQLDAHVTTSRSRAKTALIPEVDKFFGFDTDDHAKNAALSKELLMDGFHQADRKNNWLDFQSEYMRRACRAVAFSGAASFGARHPQAFSPFPMTFVAFVCTITHHIIYCYRDGPLAPDKLSVPMQMWVYRHYMKLLLDMFDNHQNTYSIAIGTISDYCREAVVIVPAINPADAGPMRAWSPDAPEPYVCRFPDPSSDCEMDVDDDNREPTGPFDDDYASGENAGF
ncbi:hypothetical protein BDV93DRAFT_515031 [Ceratobasidium sp. AG-I]|nr:hypothetical protein BDV93DRAFT_515031 [Ceratobasidium sp. AG-I]